jgi:hypothetical protein
MRRRTTLAMLGAAASGEARRDAIVRERFAARLMDVGSLGPRQVSDAVRDSKTFLTSVVERLQLAAS